jgi:hypothetical protein
MQNGWNKDDDALLKRAPTMENMQLTMSDRYSIFEEDNIEEGHVIHTAVDNNVIKNNLCDKNQFINREGLKEQNKVINKTVWNTNDQQEAQCIQKLSSVEPHRSQNTDGKRRSKYQP